MATKKRGRPPASAKPPVMSDYEAERELVNLNPATHPHKCICCGKRYDSQEKNFCRSQSPLYKGNDGFFDICNSCLEKLIEKYMLELNDSDEVIKRMCLHLDIYLSENILNNVKDVKDVFTRFKSYLRLSCLIQHVGKTYDTYIDENFNNSLSAKENIMRETGLSQLVVDRWGVDMYSPSEYIILEDHYQMLKKQNPNCNENQEIYIKDLCVIKLQQRKAIKADNNEDIKKLMDLYRATFKEAGLKTVVDTDNGINETYGLTLSTMIQYSPDEYYKDKSLYKDFDGFDDYITRHVFRPLKNAECGTNEDDSEFFVNGSENNE